MTGTAITGLGVLSPYGIGAAALFDGLMSRSAAPQVRKLHTWLEPDADTTCFFVDDADVAAVLGDQRRRTLNAETCLLLAAARLALADARLDARPIGDRTGIVVSSCHAGLGDYAELLRAGLAAGVRGVNPARGPQTGLSAPAAHVSIRLGLAGPSMTIANGAGGGLDALAYAADTLDGGRADAMLVGGVDVVPRIETVRPHTHPTRAPTTGARPFDRDRAGPVAGEAGVVVVLERLDSAEERLGAAGSVPRARLGAVASAFSPEPGLSRASLRSLHRVLADRPPPGSPSGVSADRAPPHTTPSAVIAGASGSVTGDAAEALALYRLLGKHVPVCAIKGGVGNCAGAAALAQVATAVLSSERGRLPPTPGFTERDERLAPIRVLTEPASLEPGPIAVNAWDEDCRAASAVIWGPICRGGG
jgi:3-oxoacyl-(acyl-carrier-protein) synthase